jgi:hypothetical protein
MPRTPLLAAAVALLLGSPAAADPLVELGWSVKSLEHGMLGAAELRLPAQPLKRPSAAAERPPEPAPASDRRRLGLFAKGMSFSVLHAGEGTDVRGGAYLRILRNLTFRSSYRVFDYDLVEGDSTSEKDYHGPLFGLHLRF